jgi:hypothetical protein
MLTDEGIPFFAPHSSSVLAARGPLSNGPLALACHAAAKKAPACLAWAPEPLPLSPLEALRGLWVAPYGSHGLEILHVCFVRGPSLGHFAGAFGSAFGSSIGHHPAGPEGGAGPAMGPAQAAAYLPLLGPSAVPCAAAHAVGNAALFGGMAGAAGRAARCGGRLEGLKVTTGRFSEAAASFRCCYCHCFLNPATCSDFDGLIERLGSWMMPWTILSARCR